MMRTDIRVKISGFVLLTLAALWSASPRTQRAAGLDGGTVSSPLVQVVRRLQAAGVTRGNARLRRAERFSNPLVHVAPDGAIQCYVVSSAPPTTASALRARGCRVERTHTGLGIIQAWIPFDLLGQVAALPNVREVRQPDYPVVRTGSVNSQGDAILLADQVRAQLNVAGAGVTVGVISDGIAGLAQSQSSGDLPATVQSQSARADGNLNAGAEGTAMLEIIHDLAPQAALCFSNPGTSVEMVDAINILLNTFNCDVIVDDLGFFGEPIFEDGAVAQAAQNVVNNGRVYVSAAGNEAEWHYEGDFAPVTAAIPLGSFTLQDFGGGDHSIDITVPGQGSVTVLLQWADQFGASGNDYDVLLTNPAEDTILGSGTNTQDGNDNPVEAATWTNPSSTSAQARILVRRNTGADRRIDLYALPLALDEHIVTYGSIFGHPAAPGVIAAAAISASEPGNDATEPFSAEGPCIIAFPAPDTRQKPDLCGIDGVSVTGNGGFPTTFFGTSAAAPHVAALAALVKSADPSLTPAQVKATLMATAVDIEAAGFDEQAGAGRGDALAAVRSVLVTLQLSITAPTTTSPAGATAGGSVDVSILYSSPLTPSSATVVIDKGGTTAAQATSTGPFSAGSDQTATITVPIDPAAVEGTYDVTVTLDTPSGQTSATEVDAVVIDNTAPQIVIISPTAQQPAAVKPGDSVDVQWQYTESRPAGGTIKIAKGGTQIANFSLPTPLTAGTDIPRTDLMTISSTAPDDVYDLEVTVTDEAGNQTKATESGAVTVQGSNPVIVDITLSDPSPTKAGVVTFSVLFNLTMDQAVQPTVTFGQVSPFGQHTITGDWAGSTEWRGSFNITSSTGDGIHTIRVANARSLIGAAMTPDTSHQFTIDTVPPEAFTPGIRLPAGQTAVKDGDTLTWTGSAPAGVAVKSATLRQRDSAAQLLAADIDVSSSVTIGSGSLFSGASGVTAFDPQAATVELAVSVVDAADNETEGTSTAIRVDNAPPTVSKVSGKLGNVEVTFAEEVMRADAESPLNYTVQTPIGQPINLAGRSITYDSAARTAKIPVGSLTTNATIRATVDQVRDMAGNPMTQQTVDGRVAFVLNVAGGSTLTGRPALDLVSVPFLLSDPRPEAVFGNGVRLAEYDPTLNGGVGGYRFHPTQIISLRPGTGYWVQYGATITRIPVDAGSPAATSQFYQARLPQGWSILGNPFIADLDWRLDAIEYSVRGSGRRPLADLMTQTSRPVEPYAWAWDSVRGQYRLVFDLFALDGGFNTDFRGAIQAGEAVFIRTNTSGVDLFLPRPSTATLSPVRQQSTDGSHWTVRLQAADDAQRVDSVVFGVNAGLTRGLETAAPPAAAGDESSLALVLLGDGGAPMKTVVRSSVGGAWSCEVRGALSGRTVTLSWPDLSSLPRSVRLVLEDPVTGRRVAMRTTSSYAFRADAGGETHRRFIIRGVDASHGALRIGAVHAQSRGRGVLVSFVVNRAARIEAVVRTPAGRLIDRVPARSAPGGIAQIRWDGRDLTGRVVPAGAYLIEVHAVTADGERTRAVTVARQGG